MWLCLEHCVREDLKDKSSKSRNVIFDPVKVIITNYPEGRRNLREIENNVQNPNMGTRKVSFSRELWIDGADFMEEPPKKYFRLFPGNEVRLKGAYLYNLYRSHKNPDGTIKEIHCTYDPKTKAEAVLRTQGQRHHPLCGRVNCSSLIITPVRLPRDRRRKRKDCQKSRQRENLHRIRRESAEEVRPEKDSSFSDTDIMWPT